MPYRIKKGLDLPIAGAPEQVIHEAAPAGSIALLGADYIGLKPGLLVKVGDRVKKGQTLFADKHSRIQYTSPVCGMIDSITRGAKRILTSIIINIDGDDEITFTEFSREKLTELSAADIRKRLLVSGLWVAFRTRPFSRNPDPASIPDSIFVTAMDSNPLAADPEIIINTYKQDFQDGISVIANLFEGRLFICKDGKKNIDVPDKKNIRTVDFSGPHPAGLPGTHIHYLDPVGNGTKSVWYINYQDVIAIGKLFTSGRIWSERIISLAGPQVTRPRLLKTLIGADLTAITSGELKDGLNRIISGSVLSGRKAGVNNGYLGRYHHQVSVIKENFQRGFLGWLGMGNSRFSINKIFISCLFQGKKFEFTSTQHGNHRAMIPLGNFERVLPLDIPVAPFLKSLLIHDIETARDLGCLELDEEDLALCSYVCCGKLDYGKLLRDVLTEIEAGES